MKRLSKVLATAGAAVIVLAASAGGASAATFTASETGELTGTNTTDHVFVIGGTNKITCHKVTTTAKVTSTANPEQHVTVHYTNCTYTLFNLFTGTATVSDATYTLTAGGSVHLENTVSIKAAELGCETLVGPQTVGTMSYKNVTGGKLEASANITGIVSTSPNGCPTGTSGTYTGTSLLERVGGGTFSWDA